MRYGMVIDLLKCAGCQACVVACRAEHGSPPGVLYNRVQQICIGLYPEARPVFAPMACRHCEDPDCVKVCPTGASYQREDGLVLVDQDKCIGCQACLPVCRYGARSLVKKVKRYYPGQESTPYELQVTRKHQKGMVEKCDFCRHLIDQGRNPACVDTCPAQARYFGNLDDPDSLPMKKLKQYPAAATAMDSDNRPCLFYIRCGGDGVC